MNTGGTFPLLFEKTRIGQMEMKNRLVMAPMGTNLADEDGFVKKKHIDYYRARAAGGVGLIIVEAVAVSLEGRGTRQQMGIFDDRFVSGLSQLASTIHSEGARAATQLGHSGRLSRLSYTGCLPVAPSALAVRGHDSPIALSTGEVHQLLDKYVSAAERAKLAGFDGVELQASGGYLVCSFLSAASNRREDEYGGPLVNRARFLLDIISGIKARLGNSFPVWYRACLEEFGVENGINLDEAKAVAAMAVKAGADAIEVHATGSWSRAVPPMGSSPGVLLPGAAEVKKAVGVPVMAASRMTPAAGEDALNRGLLDLVVMGRALIADPALPQKLETGRIEDVRECIACMLCLDRTAFGDEVRCTVNAAAGREEEFAILPAVRKKKVVVIGGGPAGMEAARVATLRGHKVSLIERGSNLGGRLVMASKPPGKDEISKLHHYLIGQISKLGVDILLGKELPAGDVARLAADAVVLAMGSSPLRPSINGIDRNNIAFAEDVLLEKVLLGQKLVVVGGGMVGCETAMFLAARGKQVTLVEMQEKLALDMLSISRRILLEKMAGYKIDTLVNVIASEITSGGLVVVNRTGQKQTLPADNIVLATGYKPEQPLYRNLPANMPQVHMAGDAVRPRRIVDAIEDGYRIGISL